MKQRVLIAIAVVLSAAGVGVAIAVGAFGEGGGGSVPTRPGSSLPRAASSSGAGEAARTAKPHRPPGPVPALPSRPSQGRYFAILQLRGDARVPLLASPGGRLVGSLSGRSGFGSPRVLGVVRQKGSWLGVTTPLRSNGKLGWVRFDAAKLARYWTRYWLRVVLSRRALELRYGRRLIGRYTVTVGAAGSDTPLGRFSITDALAFDHSPYYGCCALALSGHQEHLPVGWLGGNRIAIHGTPGPVGYAASHGCIRATDATMRILFHRVPLGTPVFVDG
jgi:hypothetical protein